MKAINALASATELLDRDLLVALLPGGREGVVEVRADHPFGPSCLQRVARSAARLPVCTFDEQGATLCGVAALDDPSGAAAGREQGGRAEQDGRSAPHYASCATASSRVG